MPTFLSFRRPAAEKQNPEKTEPADRAETRKHEQSSSSKHGSSKERTRRSDPHSESFDRQATEQSTGTVKEVSSGETAFVIDTEGDKQNVVYNSVYAGAVPPYRRFGSGRVLGLDRNQRIDRTTKDDKSLLVSDPAVFREEKPNRSTLPRVSNRAKLIVPQLLDESERAEVLRSNYIALDNDDDATFSQDNQNALTSLRHPENSQQLANPSSMDLGEQNDVEGQLLRKRAALQKLVKLEPGELKHWIGLAAVQDQMIRNGRTAISQGEEQGIAEVKLSFYDKALKGTSLKAQDRTTLAKLLMMEVEKVFDVKIQKAKWAEIVKEPGLSIELWANYLEFVQTQPSNWNVPDARFRLDNTKEVVRTYKSAETGSSSLADMKEAQDRMEIYRILRVTLMMMAAGFTENAVAIWQALIELNFLRPDNTRDIKGNFELEHAYLRQFRSFWDAEGARIGEIGVIQGQMEANKTWMEREVEDTSQQAMTARGGADVSWSETERLTWNHCQLPSRVAQEDDADPYRVVLYDDITTSLGFFGSGSHRSLLDSFLSFCGLSPIKRENNAFSLSLLTDAFLRGRPGWSFKTVDADAEPPGPFDFAFSCFYPEIGGIRVTDKLWLEFELSPGVKKNPQLLMLVRRVLESLLGSGQIEIAEYLMDFYSFYFPDEATVNAKRLLRKFDHNIPLYCSYALFERRRGRLERSEGILQATAGMIPKLSLSEARSGIILYRKWAWQLIVENRLEDGLRVLRTGWQTIVSTREYADMAQQASSMIYKPFELGREHMLREDQLDLALEFQICNAYYQYLSTNADLQTTLAVFRYGSQLLSNRNKAFSTEHEKLQQAKALLLYNHTALHSAYKPALLREEINESLSFFPNNTIFLSLARWIESKVGIEDRLRSELTKTLNDSSRESIVRTLFAIWMEQAASRGVGYNSNSLRAAFQRATVSHVAKHNAAVWGMYFQFEAEERSFDKAKAIFFDGIRACPWDKGLVLLAFEYEGSIFSEAQLRDIYRLAMERGLRFHLDYEAFGNF